EHKVLSDAQVEVPGRQTTKATGASAVVIKTKNQAAESGINCCRVLEHVDTHSAIRRIGVCADRTRDSLAGVGGIASLVWHQESCLLVGAAFVAVYFTKGLARTIRPSLYGNVQWKSAARGEQRSECPAVQEAPQDALLVLEEPRLPEHGLIEQEPN